MSKPRECGRVGRVEWACAAILLVVAVYVDLRERRIPNWAVTAGAGSGLVLATAERGRSGLEAGLIGLLAGAAWWPAVFWLRLGAGDAKLAMALGAILGPAVAIGGPAAGYVICAAALGPWILWRRARGKPWRHVAVPMAPWIALGTVVTGVMRRAG